MKEFSQVQKASKGNTRDFHQLVITSEAKVLIVILAIKITVA